MVRLAYDKYLQNVSRLKNQKPFISSKTIRDTNKDPGETLESLMGFYSKQALSFEHTQPQSIQKVLRMSGPQHIYLHDLFLL